MKSVPISISPDREGKRKRRVDFTAFESSFRCPGHHGLANGLTEFWADGVAPSENPFLSYGARTLVAG
jgi:hypothetical protein